MHSTDRCSLGRAKGLELSELMALAANKDLSFNYTPKIPVPVPNLHDASEKTPPNPILPQRINPCFFQDIEEKSLVEEMEAIIPIYCSGLLLVAV